MRGDQPETGARRAWSTLPHEVQCVRQGWWGLRLKVIGDLGKSMCHRGWKEGSGCVSALEGKGRQNKGKQSHVCPQDPANTGCCSVMGMGQVPLLPGLSALFSRSFESQSTDIY